jgi:phage host-nuclease inhibitor protein Gam
MTNNMVDGTAEWQTHCPSCGTRLVSAVIDFDQTNENRAEFNAGEMAAVDYCPNPDCPLKSES